MFVRVPHILIVLLCLSLGAEAQSPALLTAMPLDAKAPAILLDGDTVAQFNLSPVVIISDRKFVDVNDAMKYYMLRRDVKVAYPYAIMAEATFKQCEQTMQGMTSESEKRKYLKQMEKIMMDQYKEDLKNMTVNQGRILIKLINRQTGTTSYDMVKELKGSLSAFMWQTVARLFGNNLKDTYDPETEDREVENIIQLIEVGAI
ncbi:MAG TPA: DUF4294 domain-containing protein [Bacteroidia bacterium]|nr:DUF4294 domain-containing protein [Bacteroidia bacterium]